MAQGLIGASMQIGLASPALEDRYSAAAIAAFKMMTGDLPPLAAVEMAIAAAKTSMERARDRLHHRHRIGSQGAIALLTPAGVLLEVVDMPILRDGPNGRPNVNAALLAAIVLKMQAAVAYVEFVGARPGEGAVGASPSAEVRGVIEGVCGAAGVSA